jgi:hypothetical protein
LKIIDQVYHVVFLYFKKNKFYIIYFYIYIANVHLEKGGTDMNFTLEQFIPLIHSNFIVETQVGAFELTLADAAELPRGNRPAAFRTPLSLLFTSPVHLNFSQDNYRFAHPVLGEHIWHLAQVMPPLSLPSGESASEARRYYEVLFG